MLRPLAIVLLAASCSGETPSEVLVRFHAGSETIARAEWFAFRVPGGRPPEGAVEVGSIPGAWFPFTVPLVPRGGDSSRTFEIDAEVQDEGRQVVNGKRVLGRFLANRLAEIAVCFEDTCLDAAPCGEGLTCAAGACALAQTAAFDADPDPCPEARWPDGGVDAGPDGCPGCDAGSAVEDCAGCPCPEGQCAGGVCAGTAVTRLDVGARFTAVIDESGTLWTWGENTVGQLGLGDGREGHAAVGSPEAVAGQGFGAVSAGARHACTIREGAVLCWGENGAGRLGLPGDVFRPDPTPLDLGSEDWLDVAAGTDHSCAVRATGALHCWGENEKGQLGIGSVVDSPPTRVGSRSYRLAAAGRAHTCAIGSDDSLWCWGGNYWDQIGQGTDGNGSYRSPVPIGRDTDLFATVSAGGNHTCAIRQPGSLWCWGGNADGQVGSREGQVGGGAAQGEPRIPEPVQVGGADSRWTMVSAGNRHTCAVRQGGGLSCWGNNDSGQLGTNDGSTSHADPTRVEGRDDWALVSAGTDHTCASTTGGLLFCWGANAAGQLGLGAADGALHDDPVRVCLPFTGF